MGATDRILYSQTQGNLTHVPEDIDDNVTYIDLGQNMISFIRPGIFSSEFIKTINLKSNDIIHIYVDSFKGLPNIAKLNLGDNLLTSFPNLSVIGKSLIYLHLDHNAISNVDAKDILPLLTLQNLTLGHNDIAGAIQLYHPGF